MFSSKESKLTISVIAIFIVAFFTYLPSIGFDFTYDDINQIKENQYVTSSDKSLSQIFSVFSNATYPGDLYRPISILSFRINFLLDGLEPSSYHLSNNLLHGIISILVFFIINIFSKNFGLSLISALLFAVHPIHVEPVVNIYGRTELLSTLFALLALLLLSKFLQKESLLSLFLACLTFFCAILSKESALCVFLIAPIFFILKDNFKISLKSKAFRNFFLSFSFTALIYLLIRFLVLKDNFLIQLPEGNYYVENPLYGHAFIERIIPAFYIFGEYLRLLALPINLSLDYSLPQDYFWNLIASTRGVLTSLLTIFFIVVLVIFRKEKWIVWGVWAILSFALTINLITPIGTLMAERLSYFASIGFITFIVFLLKFLLKDRKIILIAFLAFYFSTLFSKTIERIPVWKNNFTLLDQAIIDNPFSPKVAMIRGLHYYFIKDYGTALSSFKDAIRRDPKWFMPKRFLILTYMTINEREKAKPLIEEYLSVVPQDQKIQDVQKMLNSDRIDP